MSLDVAIQSVVFYVLSCSTCAKINHRRKAKTAAKRERAEKQAMETEQPGLYRHPSPFSTNPFWNEEIMLGPGPSKRKGGSKNASSRAINTAGIGSSVTSSGGISTDVGSSPTMVGDDHRLSGDNWNRKRYQREDEELWGNEIPRVTQRIREAIEKAESSVGSTLRMIEGRLSKSGPSRDGYEEERSPYYVARNPPVNDLHPPVVSSQPTHKGATRWMLQPPPSAKVMEGKERANRSRSDSGGSSRVGTDGPSLSRQVTGRAVEKRIRRGENPSDLELRSFPTRPDSRLNAAGITTPKAARTRSRSLQSVESSDSSEGGKRRKRKPPPLFVVTPDESSKSFSVEHQPIESHGTSVARPALEAIVSSSMAVPHAVESNPKSLPLRELPILTFDSAMNSRGTSPGPMDYLPPAVSAMPTSIPSAHSKFPGADTYKFPPVISQ